MAVDVVETGDGEKIIGRWRNERLRRMAMTNCNGKTALVTGATRGISRAVALALAAGGP
jgi:NADP-dependent 3-hydroxy acid dehydrogenase YdfG